MIFNINKPLGTLTAALALAATTLAARGASANPRPLPFTYPVDTLAEGAAEVEVYSDTTPLRVQADPNDASKGRIWESYYHLQTELEYGISDRWELGVYHVFEALPQPGGGNQLQFDGFMGRLRTRLADPGEWPIDVGLYAEVGYFHDEIELEEKILLQRRFGMLKIGANLWVEQEWDRPWDAAPYASPVALWMNPTLGATWQLSPRAQIGAEYWVRGRLAGATATDPVDKRNDEVHHFLGPTVFYNMGRLWTSLGVYAHLNDANKPQPGEAYGPFWGRLVVGLDL